MSLDEGKAAQEHFRNYGMRLARVIESLDCASLARLAAELKGCWRERRRVFIADRKSTRLNSSHSR